MRTLFFETLETLLIGIAGFLLLQAVVQNYRVDGASMDPTLVNRQHLLVNKAAYATVPFQSAVADTAEATDAGPAYLFGPPQRGDIVVFGPDNGVGADVVKRVVGLPGETVELRGGRVFIDGAALDEPYLQSPDNSDAAPLTVPADHVYVLGDNRSVSHDSRVFGPIPMEQIVGRAWASYWPPDRIALISREIPLP